MKNAFILDADVLLQCWDDAIQLAKERGKSEGEDFGEELFAVARRKGLIDKIKCLGQCEDSDMLCGELRDKGIKVISLTEEQRKKGLNP